MRVWQLPETYTCLKSYEVEIPPFSAVRFLQKYVWKGELNAGSYYLLPFTSGCKLKKRNKKTVSGKSVELINRGDTEEIDLSRELRLAWKICSNVAPLAHYQTFPLVRCSCWLQGGAVWHIWHYRRWWKWLAEFRGVQLLWAAHQWREVRQGRLAGL